MKQWIDTGHMTGFFFRDLGMEITIAVSLVFGLAASFGLWRAYLRFRSLSAVLGGWFVLLGILAGARIGFALLHFEYYRQHTNEIVRFWLGGLNGAGAAWGGVAFSILLALLTRKRWTGILDQMSVFVLPLSLAIWTGESLRGLMGDNPDVYSRTIGFPDMLLKWMPVLAALLFMLVLAAVERMTRSTKPGLRGAWLLLLTSLLSLGLSIVNPGGERPLFGMNGTAFLWTVSSALLFLLLVGLYLQSRKTPTIEPDIEHPEVIHEA